MSWDQKELDTMERDRAYHDGFDAAGGTRALCEMKQYSRWFNVMVASGEKWYTEWECGKCFNTRALYDNDKKFKYCPDCGAKIEKYVEEK